jgi:hypothetical protein
MHIPLVARLLGLVLALGALLAPTVLAANSTPFLRILRQPVTQGIFAGANTELSVLAEGDAPLTYQWYQGTNPLVGATNNFFTNTTLATLAFNNTSVTNAGDYNVVVRSGALSVTSSVATLKVLVGLPSILRLANSTNSVVNLTNVVDNGGGPVTNVTQWNRHVFPVSFTIQGDDRVVALTLGYSNGVVANPRFEFLTDYVGSTNHVLWVTNHPSALSFVFALTNSTFFTNVSQLLGNFTFETPASLAAADALRQAGIQAVTTLPVTNLVAPYIALPSASRRVYGTNEGDFPLLISLQPQIIPVGSPTLNRQTGYLVQPVDVVNISPDELTDIRLLITGLTNDTRGVPVSLVTSVGPVGTPPVPSLFLGPLAAYGGPRRVQLEYYVSDGRIESLGTPGYVAEAAVAYSVTTSTGRRSITPTPTRVADGVLLEFPTLNTFSYYVRYTDTLTDFSAQTTNDTAIRTALPPFRGNGRTVQWLDNGPPRTVSAPTTNRFYRVLEFR